jgi:hypothetical protein
MSDTPETDALYAQMLAENPGNFIHLEEFLELACRLERERDEWYFKAHENFKFTLDARAERDEARTTIEDAKRALNATDYEGVLLAALRVKAERDEARESRNKWEKAAFNLYALCEERRGK